MKKKYLVLQFEFNLLPNQVSETKQEFLSNQFLIYNQFMQIYNKNCKYKLSCYVCGSETQETKRFN